ncbi:MAG: DUF1365 domain-containing protein [Psychromonas sp.]
MEQLNSRIYVGQVNHHRFSPRTHSFNYKMFLLAIDLDEMDSLNKLSSWFRFDKFAPLTFKSSDYLSNDIPLGDKFSKQAVWQKVAQLGGENLATRVLFVGQLRCFGFYFSPINMYYCYDQQQELRYLLVEVSNTPWNERFYYLIDMHEQQISDKEFHVSPFMDLQMKYHWRIKAPSKHLSLHIESYAEQKMFSASLSMKSMPFTHQNLRKSVLSIPSMTLKTLAGIYWQALKLFVKGVRYIPHPEKRTK